MSNDIHIVYQDYESRRLERLRYLCKHNGKNRTQIIKKALHKIFYDVKEAQQNGKEIVFC